MSRIEDVYGLTPAQEGIYAYCYQNTGTNAYRLDYLFAVDENAPVGLLRQALELLPARHPVLKTAFAAVKGTLKQVILADRLPEIAARELGDYTPEKLDAAVLEVRERGFDLQKDPLFRCTFFLFVDRRFLFVETHHLIVDGWCMPVLFEDLLSVLAAIETGEPENGVRARLVSERGAAASFADYVNLVRRRDPRDARDYWVSLLSGGAPAALPKAAETDGKNGTRTLVFGISAETRAAAEALARANALPPNAVYESAFALTLLKYTGRSDVVFHKAVSGRTFGPKGLERTVGPMLNTVPVRATRSRGQTPLSFLKEMNEQSVCANAFGFLSLAEVCRGAGIDPNAVDALFDFGNYPAPTDGTSGPLRLLKTNERTEFPLSCMLSPVEDGCRLTATYDGAVLSEATVRALTESFLAALRSLCAMNGTALGEAENLPGLLALTEDERARIAAFCNGPTAEVPEMGVYQLFEEREKADPGAVKITDGEKEYTFADLRAAAEKTDAYVRSRVGDKKQVIGVLCDRGFSELAAIYGIVRGGNAYLPLSPDFPKERIEFLLKTADCRLVLAQKEHLHLTEKAVPIEELLASPLPETVPAPAATPDDTLYVIFTSGSTGAPKGAMVTNRSIVNRVGWMANEYFDRDTVVMRKTPYTFDVSVWEIFGFAMRGFSLHILPPGDHYRMGATLNAIADGKVTDLHFVPTVFDMFLAYLEATPEETKKLGSVKHVFLSGETLHAAAINAFYRLAPAGVTIHNLYGPAECAVDVTYFACAPGVTDPVPIGRPVDNTRICVLDNDLRRVPLGVTGQICIAGMNVGQGYLGDPARTAEKFIDDPFGDGKMYLTGDLGYWREDGELVFVGRNDFQVKLNGQRIEPGEIEALMTQTDGVTGAAVLVKREPDRLAAFYTGSAAPAALSDTLRAKLPPYMVPSVLIPLDKMPLNASGKTDRAALSALPLPEPTRNRASAPPANETEKAICRAFENVLSVEKVGRHDSFHTLGGTSLQLVTLLSRAPLDKLTPAEFLSDPTPAGLAKMLDGEAKTGYTYLVPLYEPENAEKAVVLFPYAGGDAAAYTALVGQAKRTRFDTALYFVDWPEKHELPAIAAEIGALAKTLPVGFYSHCAGAGIALLLLDELNAGKQTVRFYIAGGSVPPRRALAGFNAWTHMPDDAIRKLLTKAGFPNNEDGNVLTAGRLSRFRGHTRFTGDYFREKKEKTNARVTVVLSRRDPLTRDYAAAEARWRRVVSDVEQVILLDTPTHYFQNTDAQLLLELFAKA